MHHPIDRIAHTTAFIAPVVEHWLEREIMMMINNVYILVFDLNPEQLGAYCTTLMFRPSELFLVPASAPRLV